ncbi:3-oxoacyl-[acyl-carrier-protein] reductase [uncultured Slackia sp.]|uniref:3-oxoacyl-[acyl-carrier-protein] reductase n=1 Tax=uncultured Slackia sp. TaxID=665903 RepID=UPI002606850C|nr:3-oxoacyl-[acyl-carrier-protein] reductase [uncultured Slackia sp.]
MNLNGKTAIVTGASRGIGAAVAERLASLGANVAVIYAGSAERAAAVCARCRELGSAAARAYQCDVADFDAVKRTVDAVRADFGGVDLLVNNAGVNRDGLLPTMREADFDAVVAVNLKGTFNFLRHCSRLFLRAGGGRIVNISSVAGVTGNAGQANYAASKAGIIGLTKSLAREVASRNVTVNAVAPGFIDTDMTRAMSEKAREAALSRIASKRLGRPEDVANAVAFLASDAAGYITGQVIGVDGGISL